MARLIKGTQALIEVKHRRFQMTALDSTILEKNKTIQKMADAHKICYDLNLDYRKTIDLNKDKWKDCEQYAGTIEEQNKKLTFRQGFMQIGTPLIAIGVGALGFIVGYYVSHALH